MTPDTLFELVFEDGRVFRSGEGGSVKEWWIDSDYLTSTDAWRCSFVARNREDRKLLEMAPVELRVDGRAQLIGRVDVSVRGQQGMLVELRGRDYLADLVECNLDPLVSIKVGDKLDKALLMAAAPLGILGLEDPEVKMEKRTGAAPKKLPTLKDIDMQQDKPEPGSGCWAWMNRVAARHGYTIQPASVRSKICLETPNYLQATNSFVTRRDDGDARMNVISGVATRDFSSVPTFAFIVGASGKASEKLGRSKKAVGVSKKKGKYTPQSASKSIGDANQNWDLSAFAVGTSQELSDLFDKWTVGGRWIPMEASQPHSGLYRLLYVHDKLAKTSAQIGEAVWREVSDRLKQTLIYECTLRGTRDPKTGLTYAINTMAMVDDELTDVNELMWVAGRGMGTGESGGTISKLKLWRPGSFQIGKEGHGNG
jgi:prophage tail gpP-like protein